MRGAEAGEEAAVLGRRKEPALSSAPCPFPAASAAAVTAVTAVRVAAGPTMQGGGPRGAPIQGPSQGAGRARGSGRGRARPAEIRAHPGAGEGNRGRERVVQGEGGRVPSSHCCSRPSASPPWEPSGLGAVGGGRARTPSLRGPGGPAGVRRARVRLGAQTPSGGGADPAGMQGEVGRGVGIAARASRGAARRPLPSVNCDAQGSAS